MLAVLIYRNQPIDATLILYLEDTGYEAMKEIHHDA